MARLRRRSDDPFFADGDVAALKDANTQAFFYVVEKSGDDLWFGDTYAHSLNRPCPSYPCTVPGCDSVLGSLSECESHFERAHLMECGQCHAVFSSDYLLDLVR